MSKAEIDHHFKDIVAFAEVGDFIDTPLKRYSSGMGMRLAFSVAAHLNPEILLMDEVLAVGDVAFQQRCLSKMNEVARTGRTILFVSHNMAAVREFCHRVIVLDQGRIIYDLPAHEAIRSYIRMISKKTDAALQAFQSRWVRLDSIRLLDPDGNGADHFFWSDSIKVQCDWQALKDIDQFTIAIKVYNEEGVHILTSSDHLVDLTPGRYRTCLTISDRTLNANAYLLHLHLYRTMVETIGVIEPAARFTIQHERIKGELYDHRQEGVLKMELPWTTERMD